MRLLKHHLRRIRMPKVPLCWSGRLGQRPSSQQAVLSTIIIQLLILQIVSHRPSRPEKRIDSRTTTTKLSFCPGSRPDFRTTIEILRSRPENRPDSRMTSSFGPSRPEKHLDSRMATTQSRRSEPLVELAQSALSGRPSYSPTALSSR